MSESSAQEGNLSNKRGAPFSEVALAERLLSSLDHLSEFESARLWLDEAERRAGEIDLGEVELVSAEELERQVQQIFK
jgi:hypothetical protein